MGMMRAMDAAVIRWSVLEGEFDPEGMQLNKDMPRWNIGNDDLAALYMPEHSPFLPYILPAAMWVSPSRIRWLREFPDRRQI